jgi:class 3 adenylate cyclase
MGVEEMVVLVTADGKVGYLNAPLAKLLGVSDRKRAVGMPLNHIDDGPIGEGVLTALAHATRSSGDAQLLERRCPGLDVSLLPATAGERPAVEPLLRLAATPNADQVQIVVQDVTRLRWLEDTFARYVSPSVIERMHDTRTQDMMEMREQQATLLFADLRGFTKVTQAITPAALQQLINAYLENMAACVDAVEGTIEGFAGDGIMAIFGAPLTHDDHALRALVCATEMQRRHGAWLARRTAEGLPAPELGIGIGTGAVIAGNIGTPRRLHYTAIGHTTNLSARLCGAAAGGQILITPEVHSAAVSHLGSYSGSIAVPRLSFESLGSQRFKNVEAPVEVIAVRVKG